MPDDPNLTDALNQALGELRMGGAEKSLMEIVSRTLGVPIEIVHRVAFACDQVRETLQLRTGVLAPAQDWAEYITDPKVREAIEQKVANGLRRYVVRWAIEHDSTFPVHIERLLPRTEVRKVCRGCPMSLECTAASLHTPQECYDRRIPSIQVKPLRIIKNTVEVSADHPAGTYIIPLEAVPRRPPIY